MPPGFRNSYKSYNDNIVCFYKGGTTMLSILSSILTAIVYRDKIEEEGVDEVLNDSKYLTTIIGFTFIFEMFTTIALLIRKIIKK